MPKRSRSGELMEPALVVAPTRVNRGREMLRARAVVPLPTERSRRKSSMAG